MPECRICGLALAPHNLRLCDMCEAMLDEDAEEMFASDEIERAEDG